MITHYGIELARLADLPVRLLEDGKRVAMSLADLKARNAAQGEGNKTTNFRKALLRVISTFTFYYSLAHDHDSLNQRSQLRTQLHQTLEYSNLPNDELLTYVARFQGDFVKAVPLR